MNIPHPHHARWGVRSFRTPALLLAALATVAAACDDAPFAMVQSHLVTTAPEPPSGFSCSQLSGSGSTGSGGVDDGFWITETQDPEGVVVEWGQDNTKLGKREFPASFFEAGDMDRFVIEAPNGDRFSYMVWGAESCSRCPEQAFTALDGDRFGCGAAPDGGADARAERETESSPPGTSTNDETADPGNVRADD